MSKPKLEEYTVFTASSLFPDDTLAMTTAKQWIADSLLRLTIKDCEFKEYVRDALGVIIKSIPCEAASIIELNHSDQTLFFRAVVGQSSDQLENFIIPLGQGIVGHVAESRQPAIMNHPQSEQKHLKSIDNTIEFETKNLIAVPVIIRNQVYGVVELINRVGEGGFSQMDLEIMTYFAESLSRSTEARLMIAWGKEQNEPHSKSRAA